MTTLTESNLNTSASTSTNGSTTCSYSTSCHDQLQKNVFELLSKLSRDSENIDKNGKPFEFAAIRNLLNQFVQNIESRIEHLGDKNVDQFEEDWMLLAWSILQVLSRLHFIQNNEYDHWWSSLNNLLLLLVNRANPIRSPLVDDECNSQWMHFQQIFNRFYPCLHEFYNIREPNLEQKLSEFYCTQWKSCIASFRQATRNSASVLHTRLRVSQVSRMLEMKKVNDDDVQMIHQFYTTCLYILGLIATTIQSLKYDGATHLAYYYNQSNVLKQMISEIHNVYEQTHNDALLSVEPSSSSILVTNNLFPFSCNTLSASLVFQSFDIQIVSEDTALAIQEEIKDCRIGSKNPANPSIFPSAALLAMKPTSGVKRNNATANASGGGNTAHKKSDVNSKESVRIVPTFSEKRNAWYAQYPHLLCTTRQKDTVLLDTRSGQIGKRPLFYFYIRGKAYSPNGAHFYTRTLSLPFTIATRRNQDCQVQRMMSSYTATCFWLYGTGNVDELLLTWNDEPVEWTQFKKLCSQYFTINAEVQRRMEECDFELLELKMHCDDCDSLTSNERLITFKNVLCPHLYFETDTTSIKFSVWRGLLEVLQIFQEQKTGVKSIWDDYTLHGFLDTSMVINRLRPSTLLVRLTYILSGSVCISYCTKSGQLVHLEPIELKKLQAKNIVEYLADIGESAKIDYILTARHEIVPIGEVIRRHKTTDEVRRVRGVKSNVSHGGEVSQLNTIEFTPLRVAVVTCRDNSKDMVPYMDRDRHPNLPGQPMTFESQLETLMKMFGKTPAEVCDMFYPHQPIPHNGFYPAPEGYLADASTASVTAPSYEYC